MTMLGTQLTNTISEEMVGCSMLSQCLVATCDVLSSLQVFHRADQGVQHVCKFRLLSEHSERWENVLRRVRTFAAKCQRQEHDLAPDDHDDREAAGKDGTRARVVCLVRGESTVPCGSSGGVESARGIRWLLREWTRMLSCSFGYHLRQNDYRKSCCGEVFSNK